MMKRVFVGVIAATLLISGCKKRVAISDEVKADLKNYMSVELPKVQDLFQKMHQLREEYREDREESKKASKAEVIAQIKAMQDARKLLEGMKFTTEDVRGVHNHIVQAISKIEQSFKMLAVLDKTDNGLAGLSGAISAMKGIFEAMQQFATWSEELENACKRNNLEKEYQDFKANYSENGP
jgi:outer membrane murein-binding lipoprotein Lpp